MGKPGFGGRCTGREAALGLVLLLSSCEPFTRIGELSLSQGKAARRLEGNEISLVTTRFPGEPEDLYTRASRFQLSVSFDPVLVDLTRLTSCGLWSQDRPGGPWRRLGTFRAKREAVTTVFSPQEDGAYGLRVSALYEDGSELLVPTPLDRPLVWLHVDREPPKLTWISPSSSTPLLAGQLLEIKWGASEMRFGDAPSIVEWSPDGGATWSSIGRVKPGRGTGSLSWRVPELPSGGKLLVRITAWDLVGNRATAVLPLSLEGSRGSKGQPVLASAGGSARAAPGEPAGSAAPGPARGSAPASLPVADPVAQPVDEEARQGAAGPGRARAASARGEAKPAARVKPFLEPGGAEPLPSAEEVTGRPEAASGPLVLKNFQDGAVHPGGATRYVFFSIDGFQLERTRVTIEWRAAPAEPFAVIAPAVPAREGKFLWKLPPVTTAEGNLRLTAIESPSEGSRPEAGRSRPAGVGRKAVVESGAAIRIDSLPPVAEIRGIQRGPDGSPRVALNCYDRGPAGLAEAELYVTTDGGATYQSIPVEDPQKPVVVSFAGSRMGFFLFARDKAGNETARPEPGTPPQMFFDQKSEGRLVVESLEEEFVRGGDQRYLIWRFEGAPGQKALVEASRDGGGSWEPVAEAPAASGKALWIAPGESCALLLRVLVKLPDGSLVEGRAHPIKVDGSPPQLEPGQVPARVAGEVRFPLSVTDPGGSGVDSVAAFVRPARGKTGEGAEAAPWKPRPEDRVALDAAAGQISISVADLPEGSYELFLSGRDRAGNGGQPPGPGSLPLARFAIDRTPVAIRAVPTAQPWVEGLDAAVQVEMDLADAVPPLWLEEKTGDSWTEVLRWETLTPGEDLYRFRIPVNRRDYQARFGVRDAVGNVSYAVVGPRPVERSLRLAALPAGGALRAGTNQPLSWTLHPALAEIGRELRVVVAHQPKAGGEWVQLYDDLPSTSACVWTLPAADAETHRIRASLLHKGKLLGQDSSEPFAITGGAAAARIDPQVVAVNENSLYYSERAELQFEKYRSSRAQHLKWYAEITRSLRRDAQGNLPPQELEKVPPELRRQAVERERALTEAAEKIRENFQKALELDPKNYRATYGMAQLLHRTAPERAGEAIRYLERTVEIKADHAPALNDLGASQILRGDYEAAEGSLRNAVAVEDLGSYHYNLALALFHQKKTAEARRHFEEALEKGGSAVRSGDVYYYIVSAFLQEGQAAEARKRLDLYAQQIPPSLREPLAAQVKASAP